MPLLNEVDYALNCVSVRWSPSDERDYTVTEDVATENVVEVREENKMNLIELLMGPVSLQKQNRLYNLYLEYFHGSKIDYTLIIFIYIARWDLVGMR